MFEKEWFECTYIFVGVVPEDLDEPVVEDCLRALIGRTCLGVSSECDKGCFYVSFKTHLSQETS